MALNKLCRSEQKFYLPTGSRLLFRIYDQRNLRSTFLPGLMIFVDDFAIELDETFAENLMPGEIDLTRYLENLNKFKIEVYWNDPSNTEKFYSWCMFVAKERDTPLAMKDIHVNGYHNGYQNDSPDDEKVDYIQTGNDLKRSHTRSLSPDYKNQRLDDDYTVRKNDNFRNNGRNDYYNEPPRNDFKSNYETGKNDTYRSDGYRDDGYQNDPSRNDYRNKPSRKGGDHDNNGYKMDNRTSLENFSPRRDDTSRSRNYSPQGRRRSRTPPRNRTPPRRTPPRSEKNSNDQINTE